MVFHLFLLSNHFISGNTGAILTRNKDGQIVLKLKTPYQDGTPTSSCRHWKFMQRLAALVPRQGSTSFVSMACLRRTPNCAEIIPGSKKNKSNASDTNDDVPPSPASVRISWARLLKRVFEIDIERCPHCGGNMKIIAALLRKPQSLKFLTILVCLPGRRLEHLHKSLILSSQPDPCSLLSILFITGLTFTPGRLSPEAPKRGKIFDFL
ncbi:MAG: hypothetical protein IPL69_19375 [Saprospiraceae bacterium]|nr:hypothetical protein [Candidatus Brachybacter algidus]